MDINVALSSDVVVIGAGQAGLSVSHELAAAGVEHVVLERDRVAESWRRRWDSFTLVTPNACTKLPGLDAPGDDPQAYLARDEVVALLEGYAASHRAPVVEGVAVDRVDAAADGRFAVRTSAGDLTAKAVVVCSGSFRTPHRPPLAAGLPAGVRVLDAADYRNPADVAPGRVVVVGSGQTGCQLAEELQLAGRDVVLACGRAPWMPRRLDGHDTFLLLEWAGFFEAPLSALPGPGARLLANPQATGGGGGHDLHLRTLQAVGVRLAGRLDAASDTRLTFADDLDASVAFGDARYADLRTVLRTHLPARGIAVPEMPDPPPFRVEAVSSVDLRDVSAIIFTTGFRPDYARWIGFDVFDDLGFPVTSDGVTAVAGLAFCGVHFLRKRKSALLLGVGEDARVVAAGVAGYVRGAGR